MKKFIFSGSGCAIITPFLPGGEVNYSKFSELIERQISAGTDAIIVAGTTGEASTMPDEEHIAVVSHCIKTVHGRIPVVAGVGSNDTAHAIRLACAAEKTGADALLCVTPYYNKASQEGLYRHFKATAKAVRIPIILYNVPSRTNCCIAPDTYARLAQIPNIVATKECQFSQLADSMRLCGDELGFYSGEDSTAIPLMALGGLGVISVLANIVPERCHQMTHDFLAGRRMEAGAAQVELSLLIGALFCDINPIPAKEALNMMGYDAGPCRLPLCELSEQKRNALRKTLQAYKLI